MHDFTSAEKQLLSTLAWFRSRYALYLQLEQNRPATKKAIIEFGKVWIGAQLENLDSAFEKLLAQEIISYNKIEFSLSEKGLKMQRELELESPFYKYEYNNFFSLENTSQAHALFCEKVYGKNLSQHGMINQNELQVLLDLLEKQKPKNILDLGCGNGKITEFMAAQIGGNWLGIDISDKAIELAINRNSANAFLSFATGNMDNLEINQKFDAIVLLDTIYYCQNRDKLIPELIQRLLPNGKIYIYFSQWIMENSQKEYLAGNNTGLAISLKNLELPYLYYDLSESGKAHWKSKLQHLEELKNAFETENQLELWDYRYREAARYANWDDDKYSRYLYQIA